MINLIGECVNPIIETQILISNYELTWIVFWGIFGFAMLGLSQTYGITYTC
jgi:hypothetical protein